MFHFVSITYIYYYMLLYTFVNFLSLLFISILFYILLGIFWKMWINVEKFEWTYERVFIKCSRPYDFYKIYENVYKCIITRKNKLQCIVNLREKLVPFFVENAYFLLFTFIHFYMFYINFTHFYILWYIVSISIFLLPSQNENVGKWMKI